MLRFCVPIFFIALVSYGCGPGKDVDLDVVLYEDRINGNLGGNSSKEDRASQNLKGTHSVVKGDTLYSIGKRYQVPLRVLISANRLTPPYQIKTGSTLIIPKKSIYIVKSGDTLSKIARGFGISTRELVVYNDLEAPYLIKVGQKIDLPFGSQDKKEAEIKFSASPTRAKPYGGRATTTRVSEAAKPVIETSPLSGDGFVWPLRGTVVKKFGFERKGVFNSGINVQAPLGTPVVASENGTVVYTGGGIRTLGNMVMLKHQDGYVSAYGHLGDIRLEKGAVVKRGDVIGSVGQSGQVEEPQLHFQLRHKKQAIDPMQHLKG